MPEEKNSLSRRDFAKSIGGAIVATSLLLPSLAGAAKPLSNDEQKIVDQISQDLIPMRSVNGVFEHKKKVIYFYKDADALKKGDFIGVNGIASVVLQLSKGAYNIDQISDIIAVSYETSKDEIRPKVAGFIKYLFDEGYVSFVSENMLSPEQKQSGFGLATPDKLDLTMRVLVKNGKKSTITF